MSSPEPGQPTRQSLLNRNISEGLKPCPWCNGPVQEHHDRRTVLHYGGPNCPIGGVFDKRLWSLRNAPNGQIGDDIRDIEAVITHLDAGIENEDWDAVREASNRLDIMAKNAISASNGGRG